MSNKYSITKICLPLNKDTQKFVSDTIGIPLAYANIGMPIGYPCLYTFGESWVLNIGIPIGIGYMPISTIGNILPIYAYLEGSEARRTGFGKHMRYAYMSCLGYIGTAGFFKKTPPISPIGVHQDHQR